MNDTPFGGIASISRNAEFSFFCSSFLNRFSTVSEISMIFLFFMAMTLPSYFLSLS